MTVNMLTYGWHYLLQYQSKMRKIVENQELTGFLSKLYDIIFFMKLFFTLKYM